MLIDIQPPSDIYDTFGRLSYKAWYALAEFVDNATQNFFDFKGELAATSTSSPALRITIQYDAVAQTLTVTDDAHGMGEEELGRALRINARPPQRDGRSEFGMGLKTAACWFGKRWTITTTRLGSGVEYQATMDLDELNESRRTVIEPVERQVDPESHGTTLRIEALRQRIHGRGVEVVKKYLASMYRRDIASGDVTIVYNGELLTFDEPPLYVEDLGQDERREWRQDVDVEVEDPSTGIRHHVWGWVGIRETMKNAEAGFALFRRNRLVLGAHGEGWRPRQVCGEPGSPEYKRLVGELNMNSFPVSFMKDGFAWDGGLEANLVDELARVSREYRIKARNLRTRELPVRPRDIANVTAELVEGLGSDDLRRDLVRIEHEPRPLVSPATDESARTEMLAHAEGPAELRVRTAAGDVVARLYVRDADPRLEWLDLSFARDNEVDVVLNARHPFVASCCADERGTAIVTRFALALALAERQARRLGGESVRPDDLRTFLDTFLKHAAR